MTITYPISLPTQPGIKKFKMTMDSVVAISESPFTYEQQVYQHQGQRWKASITLPAMKRVQAELWIATLAGQLNSRYGTFLAGDPDATAPQGIGTGTPLVNGASQTGNTLVTDGWTHSITGILLAGDYIQLGTGATARLHKVLVDANSDGSGNATFTIWPTLRYSPADNAAIVIANTVTQWRLDAAFTWDSDEAKTYPAITFGATEAL